MFDESPRRPFTGPAGQVAIVLAALVPVFLDQITTESSVGAWSALTGYAVIAAGALAVRTRWPITALLAVLVALGTTEVVLAALETQLSPLAVLPLAFTWYAVGAHTSLRRSIMALAGSAAIILTGLGINHATATEGWHGGSDVAAVLAPLPAAWGLGVAARSRRELLEAAERRADDAQRTQMLRAERAAAAERVRIARDMHDVAAHSLTLLVVHAETLRARSGELPPWAREGIDAMAAAGRQATTEMREVLGVLRDETGRAAPRSPAPQLVDIPRLVAEAERAGTPVRLDLDAALHALPRPAQLTVYRMAQESLANARRHAPGAALTLTGRAGPEGRVRVTARCDPPPSGHTATPGAGTGLTGIRERVGALGGELIVEVRSDGGFDVTAVLPDTGGTRAAR